MSLANSRDQVIELVVTGAPEKFNDFKTGGRTVDYREAFRCDGTGCHLNRQGQGRRNRLEVLREQQDRTPADELPGPTDIRGRLRSLKTCVPNVRVRPVRMGHTEVLDVREYLAKPGWVDEQWRLE